MLLQGGNLLDIRSFINSIVCGVRTKEILTCSKLEDLNINKQYRVIALNNLIENIPVFELRDVWDKVKNVLNKAGVIVIKTSLYENPNELGDHSGDLKQICCNKQTEGTLLRECLKQNLILAESGEDCFAFVRRKELSFFSDDQQKSYLTHHQERLSKYGISTKDNYGEDDYRKLVPGAGRLLIGCIAENNQKYQTQALRLVQSIRWFGGKTAGANIFVCMVDKADPEFVEELNKWNVFVRIVNRFSTLHPPSNKLRLFELPEVCFIRYYHAFRL